MKYAEHEVERLIFRILATLKEKKLVQFNADESKVRERMIQIFLKNLAEEAKLDEDARAFLAQHEQEMAQSEASQHKMLQLVKKKLAKERGFIL